MSYRALYRKWRPVDFDDVAGQEHIVSILRNEVKENKLSHAYLFCGTRGTGKTSIAKILAKAVNCENPKDGNPCNECESCKAVNSGASVDVIELDAASNNGVDDVRRIRDEVFFSPVSSKYKVYIIDEVHMLTLPAFNALLKTIEEPPSHAIFILATTEFAKVPATILSRCQRYDFRRIPVATIEKRILSVCEKENIKIEGDAAKLIAKLADGALRDALSILDQCFASTDDITYEVAAKITGIGTRTYLNSLAQAVINSDFPSALKAVEELSLTSKGYVTAAEELLVLLRDALVIKTVSDPSELLASPPLDHAVAQSLSSLSEARLLNLCSICQDEADKIKRLGGRRTDFEVFVFKLCSPLSLGSLEAYEERLFELERKLAGAPAVTVTEKKVEVKVPEKAPEKPKTIQEKPSAPSNNWAEIKAKLEPSVASIAANCEVKEEADEFILKAKGMSYRLLTSGSTIVDQIKAVASTVTGRSIKITVLNAEEERDAFDALRDTGIKFID
ncbi:MAG: DNA polymerase III subunit gamma/tau [Clostridia bacterium]|nr:DNA polymerase III subunit gamma/tau [Clostridia bacterium]